MDGCYAPRRIGADRAASRSTMITGVAANVLAGLPALTKKRYRLHAGQQTTAPNLGPQLERGGYGHLGDLHTGGRSSGGDDYSSSPTPGNGPYRRVCGEWVRCSRGGASIQAGRCSLGCRTTRRRWLRGVQTDTARSRIDASKEHIAYCI